MACQYEKTCLWSNKDYTQANFPCKYYAQLCGHSNLTATQEWPPDSVTTGKGKRIIQLSNLALRFYEHDGWTEDLVSKYIINGFKPNDRFPDDDFRYFTIDLHAQLSKDKILKDCVLQHCWFWSECERHRTDEQILKAYGHI